MGILGQIWRKKGSRKPPPQIPDGIILYAVGDIHGRSDLLQSLRGLIADDAANASAGARKIVVYLGDYVDRGLDSRGVIDLLLDPLPGFESIHLKGNHEDALLSYLDDHARGDSWLPIGGDATVMSYGVRLPAGMSPSEREAHMWSEFRERLPSEHLEFFSNLKVMHQVGDYVFVHAGVRPGTPIDQQSPKDLIWIRKTFLDSKADLGAVIVHGHSTTRDPEVRFNRIGIDTCAYATNNLTCLVLEGDSRRFLATGDEVLFPPDM